MNATAEKSATRRKPSSAWLKARVKVLETELAKARAPKLMAMASPINHRIPEL